MKSAENVQLVGRKNEPLTLGQDKGRFTVSELFKLAAMNGPQQPTMEAFRRCNTILDQVEDVEDDGIVSIGDEDWDFIKPICEQVLTQYWGINAPNAYDQLLDLINKGEPESDDDSSE